MNKQSYFCLIIAIASLASSCSASNGSKQPLGDETFASAIVAHGMKAEAALSGTDQSGHDYVTISYSLVPSNTTHNDIGVSLSWAKAQEGETQPDSAVSGKISFLHDNAAKTVTFTKVSDFSWPIVATLFDEDNPSVNCSIEFRNKQKITLTAMAQQDFDAEVVQWGAVHPVTHQRPKWIRGYSDFFTNGCISFSEVYTDESSWSVEDVSVETIWFKGIDANGVETMLPSTSGSMAYEIERAFEENGVYDVFENEHVLGYDSPTENHSYWASWTSFTSLWGNVLNALGQTAKDYLNGFEYGIKTGINVSFAATTDSGARQTYAFWAWIDTPTSMYMTETEDAQ